MARPSQDPLELRRRAGRMVAEVRPEYDAEWAAVKAAAQKLGIGTTETLRKWIRQDQIDAGTRPGRHRHVDRTGRRRLRLSGSSYRIPQGSGSPGRELTTTGASMP